MIRFENVVKQYPNGYIALNNINLQINKGEIIALIGPSGCGKTTSMKMINRLIEPTRGSVYVEGQNIMEINPVELRRNIGYVIQSTGLFPHMTIAENVSLVPKLKKWSEEKYMNRVNELLELVNLDPQRFSALYPNELSGGQQQRVGVIRALAADPPIIMMDEPFSALDPITREQLQDELVMLQEKLQKTIVFVTHDIDEAIKIGTRICIMEAGEIVQVDGPENILRHPTNDFVRNFVGKNRLHLASSDDFPNISEVLGRPITIDANKGLAAAMNKMSHSHVDTLLVVDDKNKLLGVVSVWDIMRNFANETLKVRDVLREQESIFFDNEGLELAVQIIAEKKLPYLPVIDPNHVLRGVITRAKLVNILSAKMISGGEL